jgi:ATP-dependent Zn protease
MSEMKSAFEKAMERVEQLGKASPEELQRMEYVPKGTALAAVFLRQEDYNLQAEVAKYDDAVKGYLVEGAEDTFLKNISLPVNQNGILSSKRAMEGILALKGKKRELEELLQQIEHLFDYYGQARQQLFTDLKRSFEDKIRATQASMGQQVGARGDFQAEMHPQFQEELRRTLTQLNTQYEGVLEEHKQQIKRIK